MFERSIKSMHQAALDGRVLSLELLLRVVGLVSSMQMLVYLPYILSWFISSETLPIYHGASPSNVVFWYSAFLLNSLKLDAIASQHLLAPYHVHHNTSINTQVHSSLEQV
jgi:hypothetical protein